MNREEERRASVHHHCREGLSRSRRRVLARTLRSISTPTTEACYLRRRLLIFAMKQPQIVLVMSGKKIGANRLPTMTA